MIHIAHAPASKKQKFSSMGGGRASAQGLAVAERLQKTFYFFEKRLESLLHYANVR